MCATLLAEEDNAKAQLEGEPYFHTNPVSVMCDQVLMEGSFGREQKEDYRLKHCWGQVQQINGENTNSPQPTSWSGMD